MFKPPKTGFPDLGKTFFVGFLLFPSITSLRHLRFQTLLWGFLNIGDQLSSKFDISELVMVIFFLEDLAFKNVIGKFHRVEWFL